MPFINLRDPLDRFFVVSGLSSIFRSGSIEDALDTCLLLSFFPTPDELEARQRVMDVHRFQRYETMIRNLGTKEIANDRFDEYLTRAKRGVILGQALSLVLMISAFAVGIFFTVHDGAVWAISVSLLVCAAVLYIPCMWVSAMMNKLLGTSIIPTIRIEDADETP